MSFVRIRLARMIGTYESDLAYADNIVLFRSSFWEMQDMRSVVNYLDAAIGMNV